MVNKEPLNAEPVFIVTVPAPDIAKVTFVLMATVAVMAAVPVIVILPLTPNILAAAAVKVKVEVAVGVTLKLFNTTAGTLETVILADGLIIILSPATGTPFGVQLVPT